MNISKDILYTGEVRIESNGSKSCKDLGTLIDSIPALEFTASELSSLECMLEDGETFPYLGYAFQRQYRRGGAVYNVCAIKRRRRVVEY